MIHIYLILQEQNLHVCFFVCLVFFVCFCKCIHFLSDLSEKQTKNECPSFLDDKAEGILHLCIQMRHLHCLCVHDMNEPASVQSRLKRSLFASVRLHVEDEGEGTLVTLGDVLQPPFITCLQNTSPPLLQ